MIAAHRFPGSLGGIAKPVTGAWEARAGMPVRFIRLAVGASHELQGDGL